MMDDRRVLYGFAAAHVQKYVVASAKLRDIDGASQRLEELCGDIFIKAVRAAGLDPKSDILSQAAGGARIETANTEAIDRLYAAWPMVADRFAPGVLIQQAVIDVGEVGGLAKAQQQLGEALRAARSARPVDLPVVGPVAYRCARTGRPAEFSRHIAKDRDPELLDRATHFKEIAHRERKETLTRRFLGTDSGLSFTEAELGSEERPYLALVHADGNAIGRFISKMVGGVDAQAARALFAEFSSGLQAATEAAAQQAAQQALTRRATDGVVPARGVILGGDDVTILLEARDALPYTRAFLDAFEQETRSRLSHLDVPGFTGLSASAGVAIVKRRFPYDRAHDLAESLCKLAKRHAKRTAGERVLETPSTVSFQRVTTALPGDAETVLNNELTGPGGKLTFEAFYVGQKPRGDLPRLDDLRRLATALPYGTARGQLRTLMATMHGAPEAAQEAFARMREVRRRLRERDEGMDEALETLNGARGLWRGDGDERATPLLDAYTLRVVEGAEMEATR